ncbi:TenA family protein [Halomicrobium salinisoli]|uniref:TenA family protein n=1 Tax=Halomicrobium salinisoli TaxID=2878391 RepID=UPI001CF026F9|nr:TenA family protein [Halomicrobium salinisoli]
MSDVPASYAAYAAEREDPRFTDWLRERTEPAWTEATGHRFARELGAGDLDDAVFREYLIQDYAFVEHLTGAFGHAVGEAPTMAAKSRLVDFLAVLTDDEDDYFERSFDALGVPDSASAAPERTPSTEAFVDLLERAAREGGYAETLAVLTPAEWVYLEWATAVAGESPERFYLREWIDLHAVESFASFVGWLREELDREGAAASECRQRRIERLFRRTVELEVAFFDGAYDGAAAAGEPAADGDRSGGDR